MPEPKRTFSIRITQDTYESLWKEAQERRWTMSSLIDYILESYLKGEAK